MSGDEPSASVSGLYIVSTTYWPLDAGGREAAVGALPGHARGVGCGIWGTRLWMGSSSSLSLSSPSAALVAESVEALECTEGVQGASRSGFAWKSIQNASPPR